MQSRCVFAASVLGLATFLLTSQVQADTPSIRIMPLGDSITDGVPVAGGYRDPLYNMLTNAGYNVDFVGTATDNGSATLPDSDHEGHSGWTIDGLRGSILSWFEAIQDPHVILVHIGTNDSYNDPSFSNAVTRLDALVTTLATCQPSAQIIVTSLMKRNGDQYTGITNYFNPYVPGLVARQAALGRRVTFLDMHAYLELSDMADGLHPNAGGYTNMATAWFGAITNLIATNAITANQPALLRATGASDHQHVTITLNKKVSSATATDTANYAIDGGVSVTTAALGADQRTVTLTTTAQTKGTTYTVTVNNVADETAPTPLTVPADSQVSFIALTPRGYLNNVAESSTYTLVYLIDLPNSADYYNTMPAYSVDNSANVGPFSRIAYYLELQTAGNDLHYVWVSADAFTSQADKIGIPTVYSGAVFQRLISNMNVFCNVPGVVNGTGITTGNIEFWPSNYAEGNALGIPGADALTYDFGDTRTDGQYACMQVHNYAAGQTLFALNNWGGYGGNLCLGIGNNPSGAPDWTFSNNGANYTVKTLQVLVLPDPSAADTTAPTAVSAQAGAAGTLITATFSEPLAEASVTGGNFSLDNGVQVLSASLFRDQKTVRLTTTPQPSGTPLTLTLNGIRDRAGNAIVSGTMIAVTPYALPDSLVANTKGCADGYTLIYAIDIPAVGDFNNSTASFLYNQSGITGAFDRVAYYVELVKPNFTTQYLWAAMDPFTSDVKKLAVPTFASGAIFQQMVTNLEVRSNVSGVQNGHFATGGNIEFWPKDYGEGNALGIPNANGSTYDFGDTIAAYGGGYGCMQIHNSSASQTLFAMNHFGGDGNTLDLGIGTNGGTGAPDWTFAGNAATAYARRTLYVLVHNKGQKPSLPPQIVTNAGALANGFRRVYTIDIPVYGNFNNSDSAYTYNTYSSSETFDRIAYYAELVTSSGVTQYVWAAMDAFANDETRIKVPTFASGEAYQQVVTNLDVASNVGGIVNGTGITTGNIEFWPYGYATGNALGIPNANDNSYDFGDSHDLGGDYGCMQIHNYGASQTLFALNSFGSDGRTLCLGIGNYSGTHPDWTFADNAGSYTRRTLHILVRPTTPTATDPLKAPAEVTANVPEAAGWQLAYVIDMPSSADFYYNAAAYYTVNNTTNGLTTGFSRIAYYLALQPNSGSGQYIWTAMDAFTTDATRIGVPVGGTFFQQRVTRLDVRSNVDGIVAGTGLDTGNIEFWPSNYDGGNSAGIPNASGDTFDFGDGGGGTGNGYGSMQVHNYGASQTLFAVNNFNNAGSTLCIGIGNNGTGIGFPDWTHAFNAGNYSSRRLYVFVMPGGDTGDLSRPTIYTVTPSKTLNRITVSFSEPLADSAATAAFFALNNGATVTGASLAANKQSALLTTSPLTAGQTYTLTVTGVRDRSSNANPIAPGTTASFTTASTTTRPTVLNNVPEASDYELIHTLSVGNGVAYSYYGCPYSVDESLYPLAQPFDRVAYCMELSTDGVTTNWVYVSMDAFTADLAKIGVPTAPRGAAFKTYVGNMNVYASAGANVTTGTGITTGLIEFWPSNYGQGRSFGLSNARDDAYDFDDSGFDTSAGHGSMQIHNYAAAQTIFAFNEYGPNWRTPALGIGNRDSASDPDWTFAENAGAYAVKNIYVLAHWGNTPSGLLTGSQPTIWTQPRSAELISGKPVLLSVYATGASSYQWRKNGVWIPGATQSWLALNPASCADSGAYDVLVYGSGSAYATSQAATVRVKPYGSLMMLK